MIRIPVFQDISSDFEQEINLNDQIVQIRITYNTRAGFYFLRFIDDQNNNLDGIKIVPNFPLLDYHKGFLSFNGDLIVLKTDESAGNVITYDNFGSGWDLFYMTDEEVEEWKDDNGF